MIAKQETLTGKWLSMSDAAKFIGTTPRTVRRWIDDGEFAKTDIRTIPMGSKTLYFLSPAACEKRRDEYRVGAPGRPRLAYSE